MVALDRIVAGAKKKTMAVLSHLVLAIGLAVPPMYAMATLWFVATDAAVDAKIPLIPNATDLPWDVMVF